jgi:hypothetical protein
LVEKGASERGAWALAASDAGMKTTDIQAMFGHANPRISGNLVNDAKRKVGRESEIAAASGSRAKTAVAVDPLQLMRDQLDRERAALDAVSAPVDEVDKLIETLDGDPSAAVKVHIAGINERITAMRETVKKLGTDEGAAEWVTAEKARLTERRTTVVAGIEDTTDDKGNVTPGKRSVLTANIEKLEATIAVVEGMAS